MKRAGVLTRGQTAQEHACTQICAHVRISMDIHGDDHPFTLKKSCIHTQIASTKGHAPGDSGGEGDAEKERQFKLVYTAQQRDPSKVGPVIL